MIFFSFLVLFLLCFSSRAAAQTRCSHGGLDGTCVAASACDRDDTTAGACPSGSGVCCIKASGSLFRLCANGKADAGETCQPPANRTATPSCCSEYCRKQKIGALCRRSAGPCDPEELCEGDATCPANAFFGRETMCRAALVGQACDAADFCDGRSAACPETFKPAGEVCRAARSAACDVVEVCSGRSGLCPDDRHAPAGTPCNDNKVCTDPDVCDASGACTGRVICSCSADADCNDANPCTLDKCNVAARDCVYTPAPVGTVCRASRGPCDPEERCDGTECADDVLLQANQVCRMKADLCDAPELCTGHNFQCGADLLAPAGTVCRNDNGACDVEDRCDGKSKACPDLFLPKDTQCSAPSTDSPCAGVAHCSGASGQCPAPQLPDGSMCDDGNNCTTTDICIAGKCGGKRTCGCRENADCNDMNSCTTERCLDAKCIYTTLAGGTECDGNPLLFNNRCNAAGFCIGDENPTPRTSPAATAASTTAGAVVEPSTTAAPSRSSLGAFVVLSIVVVVVLLQQ